MKKIVLLATVALMSAGSLQAHGYGHRGYGGGHYYGGWGYGGWVAPFVIGGALGYAASRPAVVYDTSPTVIYTTPQTMVVEGSPSASVVQQRTNVSNQAPMYEERWVYFEDCQCERKVLVNIQQ